MKSGYFSIRGIRRFAAIAVLAGLQMLGASVALAQTPVPKTPKPLLREIFIYFVILI